MAGEAVSVVDDLDDAPSMFIVEIRGDIYSYNEVIKTLDDELHRFGSVSSVIYFRINNTGTQREITERLGLEWDATDMPWLLVLEKHPEEIEKGDRAIQFRLGNLRQEDDVYAVTTAIIQASREPDFITALEWEKRKQRFIDLLPALRETTDLLIRVVGLSL